MALILPAVHFRLWTSFCQFCICNNGPLSNLLYFCNNGPHSACSTFAINDPHSTRPSFAIMASICKPYTGYNGPHSASPTFAIIVQLCKLYICDNDPHYASSTFAIMTFFLRPSKELTICNISGGSQPNCGVKGS